MRRCCALLNSPPAAHLRSLHLAAARAARPRAPPALLPRLHSSASAATSAAAAAPARLAAAAAAAAAPDTPIPGTTQADADGFYVLMFTCRKCESRTARRISKHGYHHGSVLVRCPGCLGLHLIADHLGFFSDEAVDAEGLLRARGEGGAGGAGGARADASVYELSAQDAAVLASAGRSVRLSDGAQLPVVDFSGAAPGSKGGSGSSSGSGGV